MTSRLDRALVTVDALKKSFEEGGRQRVILDGAALSLDRGEFVAIVGRSGSGKSTLLNLIAGVDLPDSGQVVIDGRVLTEMTETERTLFRRRHIGFVFQFFNLIPTLTVDENLRLPLELNRVARADTDHRIHQLLERVDLVDRASSYPDVLSGGEQQRVAIARAVIHRPRLVLADEPTGNLDTDSGQTVLELLSELTRLNQTTLVLVTHSVEAVRQAGRVLSIDHGILVAQR